MGSIRTMAEFTEVLKNSHKLAYDFISINSYKMDKTEIVAIAKELLYGIYNDCDSMQMEQLLGDVEIELDEQLMNSIKKIDYKM